MKMTSGVVSRSVGNPSFPSVVLETRGPLLARNDSRGLKVAVLCLTLLTAACASEPTPEPPKDATAFQLSPRETFDWSGQTITFELPPAGWRREGETGGGIKGARFVKTGSVGEGIGLGDYYLLANRHRSAYLRDIISKFETYDVGFEWDKALRGAYAYVDSPFTPLEAEIAERINTEVSAAGMAFRNRNKDAAREHLQTALRAADRLRFSLGDVIDRVEFKPERRETPEYYQVLGRREATIAGEPAVIVDYTVKVPERQISYAAREAYVVHNSHLFIATFIGLKETLAVFDAVVASIEFPK